MAESIFDKFTGKYALSKTLRFELKPVGKTEQILKEEGVFENDHIKKEKYEQTKPFFNRLHREFIQESLQGKTIDGLEKYFDSFKKLQKNKKDKNLKKNFDDISKKLRVEVNSYFYTEKLFGTAVFDELKYRYGNEDNAFLKDENGNHILNAQGEKISIFDDWKRFTGYFDKFQETRRNFYKDDGTATAIATRIVDNNLRRFCENKQLFESLKNKIDFSEVEKNFSIELIELFSLDYYNYCMLQDGIDVYNKILGGDVKENGEKIKGLNEIINKFRQDNKGEKPAYFKLLDKQILSEKDEFIDSIKDEKELHKKLCEFFSSAEEKTKNLRNLLNNFFENASSYKIEELDKIYISKEGLNTILYKWMNNEGLEEFLKIAYEQTKKEKIVQFEKDENSYKFLDFIPLSIIKYALEGEYESEKIWKEKYYLLGNTSQQMAVFTGAETRWEQFLKIFQFEFNSLFYNHIGDKKEKRGYEIFKDRFEEIIKRKKDEFSLSQEDKLIIKNFVDNTLSIYQMGKYFALEKKRKWLEEYETGDFYDHSELGYKTKFYDDAYQKIVKARMFLQSYLTKKPFNTEKWKLTFENPTLADGFDKNKESDNSAIILKKNGRYFLAIMKQGYSKIFDDRNAKQFIIENDSEKYEKMIYKLLPGASKMLPKVFFSKKNVSYFQPSDNILRIRNCASHTKNGKPQSGYKKEDFNLKDCHEMIDFFKESIYKHWDWKNFNFHFKKTGEYKDTSEFYREIENQGYKIEFADISKDYISQKNLVSELYLFEIHNKDWNLKDGKKKEGNKNMHTLYFESIFEGLNKKKNFVFKLNGEAELFFRPATKEQDLGYKIKWQGKWYKATKKEDDNENLYIEENGTEIKVSKDDCVVNGWRYSNPKIFFHVPITLNRTAPDAKKFNQIVNEFLAHNPDINVIGLDRGEKHLIYYAGVDQKGNLLVDKEGKEVLGSLNVIKGVNYYKLLEERSKGREKARQDWQNIEGIKDLKKGYISLVVRKLADLMIEHNAIIVLEDLNMRFKQIRGGIEKSVYQQLEKALIEKLNFLVNKGEKDPEKAGHLLRAYQLTAPFTTFKDMGKQTGMIFYTQAGYTSKTCPECGFRPNVKWDQDYLLNKVKIEYNDDVFTISYKVSDFVKNKNKSKRGNVLFADIEQQDDFVLSTKNAIRYKWLGRSKKQAELRRGEKILTEQTEKGITIEYDITELIKGLFENAGIDLKGNLKKQISEKVPTKKFFKDLSYALYLLSNTRSSVSGTDIDYINCACCGFHSEKNKQKFNEVGFNGDANGAYNVARKGILILKKIDQYCRENSNTLEKMSWGDLFIDIEEWDKFTQNKKLAQ